MRNTELEICMDRQAQLKRAFFRGDELRLANPRYLAAVRAILEELTDADAGGGDLTVQALGLASGRATGRVLAKEPGVVAGIEEYCWLMECHGVAATPRKRDGDAVQSGETVVEIAGERGALLAYERVGLNLLQRMSGIATMTRCFQDLIDRHNPDTHVVGTRKTPWGLLDKRAVHSGGGGTHRLSLADAILVKNNHLALLASDEKEAVGEAIRRVWPLRRQAGFIEVEVRGKDAALAAARAFRDLQRRDWAEDSTGTSLRTLSRNEAIACPCVLMLDNVPSEEAARIVSALREEGLQETILIEASGNISEENMEAYAACGVDVISVGALTHSPRVLDLCQRLA
jgi:nicotinate-nucleotide pyrophosphorylase (carboxylating)